MSHELRTPMNSIKGFTDFVLRRDKSMEDRSRDNLQKVTQASDRLLAMIDDLMDLSKIEAGRMDVNARTFNVEEVIRSACSTVSPLVQEGVELTVEVDEVGEAHTDDARLQQIVINLLSNAIKFTDDGSVTVTARRDQGTATRDEEGPSSASRQSPDPGSLISDRGQLIIAVTDTGKGIPQDELATIFDEYRQVEGSESSVQKGLCLSQSDLQSYSEAPSPLSAKLARARRSP